MSALEAKTSLFSLPTDLLLPIVEAMPVEDAAAFARTCQGAKTLVDHVYAHGRRISAQNRAGYHLHPRDFKKAVTDATSLPQGARAYALSKLVHQLARRQQDAQILHPYMPGVQARTARFRSDQLLAACRVVAPAHRAPLCAEFTRALATDLHAIERPWNAVSAEKDDMLSAALGDADLTQSHLSHEVLRLGDGPVPQNRVVDLFASLAFDRLQHFPAQRRQAIEAGIFAVAAKTRPWLYQRVGQNWAKQLMFGSAHSRVELGGLRIHIDPQHRTESVEAARRLCHGLLQDHALASGEACRAVLRANLHLTACLIAFDRLNAADKDARISHAIAMLTDEPDRNVPLMVLDQIRRILPRGNAHRILAKAALTPLPDEDTEAENNEAA